MGGTIGRREFIIGGAAVCGAGLASKSGVVLAQGSGQKSRIVEVTHKSVVSSGRKVDEKAVGEMLAKGMKALTGTANSFKKFVKPGDRVGIKINTLGRPLMVSHPELVRAIAAELTKAGVLENNIVVWDRFEDHMEDGGFAMNTGSSGVRYLAAEPGGGGAKGYDPKTAYTSEKDHSSRRDSEWGAASPVAKLFVESCDKIINVPILKDHAIAGVTLCLKNVAYGVTCNNARFHGRDHIDTFIADVCAMPEIKKKVVLHIVDGIEGCFDNGPLPRDMGSLFTPKTLWIGTDPVALDTIATKIIVAKRKEAGLMPLPAVGRPPSHINAAAKKGLGIDDPSKIKVKKVSL